MTFYLPGYFDETLDDDGFFQSTIGVIPNRFWPIGNLQFSLSTKDISTFQTGNFTVDAAGTIKIHPTAASTLNGGVDAELTFSNPGGMNDDKRWTGTCVAWISAT